jgi:HK97 gp10 family phage protein
VPDFTFQVRLGDLHALEAKLKNVTDELKYKGGRAALRKAANVVRDTAIAGARGIDDPDTAEQIAKNIVVRWSTKTFKRTGDLAFRVGVLGGAKSPGKKLQELGEVAGRGKANPGGDTWYWRLVEFGTARAGARPFMRPALAHSTGPAIETFIKEYGRALDRAIKRTAKAAA